MKSLSKLLLVSAVAVMALAVMVAPSEAAKKKKKMAAAKPCVSGALCTTPKTNVLVCGVDGKWYQAVFTPTCVGAVCPAKC